MFIYEIAVFVLGLGTGWAIGHYQAKIDMLFSVFKNKIESKVEPLISEVDKKV
jgi:hypothetical protein